VTLVTACGGPRHYGRTREIAASAIALETTETGRPECNSQESLDGRELALSKMKKNKKGQLASVRPRDP
jgi:hypothetical protein